MTPSPGPFQQWCDTALTARLDRLSRRRAPRLPAPQVLVTAPGARLAYGDVDLPFHTASVGKVLVAVLTARLIQDGLLDLDVPVSRLAPGLDLSRLPAAPGVDLRRDLTVDHLLSHRSGLPDPVLPPRGHRTECSLAALLADPARRWTTAEVVAQTEGMAPTGAPGRRFAYGDASYALLQCVLEEVAGAPYPELLREHVLAPAGMSHTGFPHCTCTDEELRTLRIAPIWVRGHEFSHLPSLSAGTADGGAVTTLGDLERLQTAVHEEGLVSPALMARLSRPRSRLRAGIYYGTGMCVLRLDELVPVRRRRLPVGVGGLGLWATHCFYYPELGAQVVMNFHSTRQMARSFRLHMFIAKGLAASAGSS